MLYIDSFWTDFNRTNCKILSLWIDFDMKDPDLYIKYKNTTLSPEIEFIVPLIEEHCLLSVYIKYINNYFM